MIGPGEPKPPIPIAGSAGTAAERVRARRVEPDDQALQRLAATGAAVEVDPAALGEASRDWWPLAMTWAVDGGIGRRAAALVRPSDAAQVGEILAVCSEAHLPVTAVAGRSGVCGAAVPVHGGVLLDVCGLSGIRDLDATSGVVEVAAGTFGRALETELRDGHGFTLGHWPQSIDLSTVGGWLACRSAGQYSTRYGKIEDMVVGLEVALADGRLVRTGGAPRAAVGPDLTQVFVGSEGTLGIITAARLRLHPAPAAERRAAFTLPSFPTGVDACRRVLQRGATPAVLRLYDPTEADRSYGTGPDRAVLLVLDEGDPRLVDATMEVVTDVLGGIDGAAPADETLVGRWIEHRNDVSALEAFIGRGFVVDTMEVAAGWSACPRVYAETCEALAAVPHALVASAHLSHSYPDGACLYFTFAARPPADERDVTYRRLWDAGTRAALGAGAALSHHHGVGLNRSRFVAEALGEAHGVLVALKRALDPSGILNPGKLGLPDPWGDVEW